MDWRRISAAAGALTARRHLGGLPAMRTRAVEFCEHVRPVVRRYFIQNEAVPPSVGDVDAFAARLLSLVAERGLPPVLKAADLGQPREMAEAECAPLVARILDGL